MHMSILEGEITNGDAESEPDEARITIGEQETMVMTGNENKERESLERAERSESRVLLVDDSTLLMDTITEILDAGRPIGRDATVLALGGRTQGYSPMSGNSPAEVSNIHPHKR